MRKTENFLRKELQILMRCEEFGEDLRNAWMLFWNEKDTSSMRDIDEDKYREFTEWYIHEYRLIDHNIPLLELYYQRRKNKLPPNVLSMLTDWMKAYYGIFEVQKVVVGKGVYLKDIISGNEFYLNDVSSSKDLLTYDILFSHIIPMYGEYYTSGAGIGCRTMSKMN